MGYRLAVVIAVLFISSLAHAGNIDKLARHFCLGEDIKVEEIYCEEARVYAGAIDDGFKKLGDFGKCLSYSTSEGGLRLNYQDASITGRVQDSSLGIMSVFFDEPAIKADSFEKIKGALDKFEGRAAVTAKDDKGRSIFAYNSNEPMALGSTFKLFILKSLVEDVATGKRKWSDVIAIDKDDKSLGSGMVEKWPDGSPVTLATLASLMISISDNTATDHLVDVVGRARLEAKAPHSVPFLKTREMFILKHGKVSGLRDKYLKGNLNSKRNVLENIKNYDIEKVTFYDAAPRFIDQLEWFATTDELADLILTMKGEKFLAINPGVIKDRKKWKFIGYKGGSEPGVIQYTQLLQAKNGRWYTISATCNDAKKPVDETRLAGIVSRIADLL